MTFRVALYREIRRRMIDAGFKAEYEWAQTVKPPTSAHAFATEYVWVVLNSGIKNQVARKIADKVYAQLERGLPVWSVFRHVGKAEAIERIWREREVHFADFQRAEDKIAFCATLPWIGPTTKYHLAKNYGVDCAKPDRWLVRLAEASGESVDGLCSRLARAAGDRIAAVDLVLWRACNLGIIEVKGGRIRFPAMRAAA